MSTTSQSAALGVGRDIVRRAVDSHGLAVGRVAALVITAALMWIFPWDRSRGYEDDGIYLSLVLSLGFAHYAASFIYARRQIGALGKTAFAWIALSGLLAANMALYLLPKSQELALLAYFGLHHMFNEVYLSHRALGAKFDDVARLRVIALVLNAALYVAILAREQLVQLFLGPAPIIAAVGLALVLFVIEAARVAPTVGRSRMSALVSVEVIGVFVAFIVIAAGIRVRFIDIVLYHFVFWALYPAMRIAAAKGRKALTNYVALNAVLLAGAMALSPVGLSYYSLSGSLFLEAFYFFSYLHITASFALSDQHPSWIIRLFRPAPGGSGGRAARA